MRLLFSLGCLTLASTCVGQATGWVQVATPNSPGPRWAHGNVFDPIRNRTYCFGGGSASLRTDETWRYDGNTWIQLTPASKPPIRRLTAMAFHFARLQTIMFGGSGASAYLNDTWAWDGTNWTQVFTANSPSIRWGHGMAYDSARQRTVLVGGLGGPTSTLFNDTWEFDGTNWTQIPTASSPPVGIFGGSIAYDAARGKVVYFGSSAYATDTWEYDGTNWAKANPVQKPPGRYYLAMDYDSARRRVVMFGGTVSGGGLTNETWEYDGTTWTKMITAVSPPARRDYDEMVYDSVRRKMVIYGGTGTGGLLSDTWEYGDYSLTATPATISVATGGTQSFALDAGAANASRLYIIAGSVTGTAPGVNLGTINIPLNPDPWMDLTLQLANSAMFPNSAGILDGAGKSSSAFNVPVLGTNLIGLKFYHAYMVYDLQGSTYLASNPVTLTLAQ